MPPLTGRVVDVANLLKPEERAAIEAKLKAHEDRSTNQVVVATVASLGGLDVEDYANRLYRAWQLGTKEKSNGVLLLVAPNERKVRIEVGYGLEGALTDALSSVIIRTAIAPRFRAGDYAGGIGAGVDAILSVLSGNADEWHRRVEPRPDQTTPVDWVTILIVGVMLFLIIRSFMGGVGRAGAYRRRGGGWVAMPGSFGSGWGGGGSFGGGFTGGGSFGGGFSGGGGSSGGGGASGSW